MQNTFRKRYLILKYWSSLIFILSNAESNPFDDTYINKITRQIVYTDDHSAQVDEKNSIHIQRNKASDQQKSGITLYSNATNTEVSPEKDEVKKEATQGIKRYITQVDDAKSKLSLIQMGLFAQDSEVMSSMHSSSNNFDSKSFENTFQEHDLGHAQEKVRDFIDEICDTKKSNMELLVATVHSLAGTDSDGNSHANKFRYTEVDVKGYGGLFKDQKTVTVQDILSKYESTKAELQASAAQGVSVQEKEGDIEVLHKLLADTLKEYNKEYNASGLLWSSNKKDNVFVDLAKMQEYFEEEDSHINKIKEVYHLEDEEPAKHYEVIKSFLGDDTNKLPANTKEYQNSDKKDSYREASKALIKKATEHPSTDMVHFLLNSASTNSNGNGPHNQAIHNHRFTTSDGYEMDIKSALALAEKMNDSPTKTQLLKDIIEKGIDSYYEENKNTAMFKDADNAFHFVLSPNSEEYEYVHENNREAITAKEANKTNVKSKNNNNEE